MKKLACCAATLTLTLAAAAASEQDFGQPPFGRSAEAGGQQRPDGQPFGFQPPRFPLMEALDADKDGKLSKEEIEKAVAALKTLDKDKDGKLSQEEIGWPPAGPGGGPGGFGGPGGSDLVERIMSNDKDKDGKVTRNELPRSMWRMLLRADANKDRAIDRQEAEAMAQEAREGGPEKRFPRPQR